MSFGPKKIRDRLRAVAPAEAWPVDSTVGVVAAASRPRRGRAPVPSRMKDAATKTIVCRPGIP